MAESAIVRETREVPLLMRPDLVRATLEGRKHQTRRLVTPANSTVDGWKVAARVWGSLDFARAQAVDGVLVVPLVGEPFGRGNATVRPRVRPGDRLWVREAWQVHADDDDTSPCLLAPGQVVRYMADGTTTARSEIEWGRGRPGIHMPRWACRLELSVEAVRVERVQAITEDDARAEGCTGHDPEPAAEGGTVYAWPGLSSAPCPRAHFATLWDAINGKRPGASWAADPWVWVYQWPKKEQPT